MSKNCNCVLCAYLVTDCTVGDYDCYKADKMTEKEFDKYFFGECLTPNDICPHFKSDYDLEYETWLEEQIQRAKDEADYGQYGMVGE